jgi:hypothetical protein
VGSILKGYAFMNLFNFLGLPIILFYKVILYLYLVFKLNRYIVYSVLLLLYFIFKYKLLLLLYC